MADPQVPKQTSSDKSPPPAKPTDGLPALPKVPKASKTNTLKILLTLNKERFGAQKLSDNNPILRQFTRQDMKVAQLGAQVITLPDLKGDRASAEAIVNKYKSITTQQAKDNFAIYSKEIKGPSQAADEYSDKVSSFKDNYFKLINAFGDSMKDIVKEVLADMAAGKQVRNRPYVERLKGQEQSFTSLVNESKLLQKEGLYLRETFRGIGTRAFSTLTDKSGVEKPQPPQASNN
jgi:hypothetical protein